MKTKVAVKGKRKKVVKDLVKGVKKKLKKNGQSNGHSKPNGHGNGDSNGFRHGSSQSLSLDVAGSKDLLHVLTEVKNGNFSVRMPIDEVGLNGKICDTLNEIISLNERMMLEFTRAGNTIGKQGKLTQRIEIPSTKGAWSHRGKFIQCT